jgi:hypothetical protein
MSSLPRCNRSEVQGVLKELIAEIEESGQPPRALTAVEEVEDEGVDTAGTIRSCTATAKFEGGAEQKLDYTVKWNDPEKKQYAVNAQYVP